MSAELYAKWKARLRGETPPMHADEPEAGFWRTRVHRDGPFVGVAIWPKDGLTSDDHPGADGMNYMRDKKPVGVDRVWPYCGRYPVTEESYRYWEQHGSWPDDHVPEAIPYRAPSANGNNEPDDEAETLADQIASARAGVADYAKIETDKQASKAQSLRARLLELSRTADKRREDLKRPHLEAGKAVDARWMPLAKDAKAGADQVAKSMSAYETAKARAAEAERRRIDEERRRQEEEARRAEEAGRPAPDPALPLAAPEPAPQPATQIRGAYGRAAAVKVVRVVADVINQDALYQHFRADPAVGAVLLKLAQRAVADGHTVPGVAVEEQRKVA